VRLAGERADGTFTAVLFGAGDWRVRTEDRPPPPPVAAGERIAFAGIDAAVTAVDARSPRCSRSRSRRTGRAVARALRGRASRAVLLHERAARAVGRADAVRGAAVGGRAAVRGPAADWELLLALRRRGVEIACVTHAAGLSSTGDAALDARLPLPERYEVPRRPSPRWRQRGRAAAPSRRRHDGRARARERARRGGGRLVPARGITAQRLRGGDQVLVVDGLLTGMHEVGTSHFELMEAFAPRELLLRASAFAAALGYQGHEFGDAMLVLAARTATPP
jgi:S-adenosylmethionine:tRNA ribosyltransferase-isomerase